VSAAADDRFAWSGVAALTTESATLRVRGMLGQKCRRSPKTAMRASGGRVAETVRQESSGPYRQRSLWRLLRVEGSSADVLDRNCLLTLIDRGEAAYQHCRRSSASSRR